MFESKRTNSGYSSIGVTDNRYRSAAAGGASRHTRPIRHPANGTDSSCRIWPESQERSLERKPRASDSYITFGWTEADAGSDL